MSSYINSRKDFVYYKFIYSILPLISKDKKSIIDIGSNGINIFNCVNCETKVSLDLYNPVVADGITSIKCNFLEYKVDKKYDICTCFQVLEHVNNPYIFANHLLQVAKIIFVSVPYKWPIGLCKEHCQDPIDEIKLQKWFNKSSIYSQVVDSRLFAIFTYDNLDEQIISIIGNKYTDLFKFNIDISKQSERQYVIDSNFFKLYKNKIDQNQFLKKELFEYIYVNAMKYNNMSEEYFILGIYIYPHILDKFGHPLFIKEYIRYLLSNNEYSKAKNILSQELISTKIVSTTWSYILFARAYEKNKNYKLALQYYSYLKNNTEADEAIKRIQELMKNNNLN